MDFVRKESFDRFEEIKPHHVNGTSIIRVFKTINGKYEPWGQIRDEEDLLMWQEKLARELVWPNGLKQDPALNDLKQAALDKIYGNPNYAKDHINPPHYKNVVESLEWIEVMKYLLKGKTGLEAGLYMQIYKYLMRSGGKDDELQEERKALWYLKYLIACRMRLWEPVKPKDVDDILDNK